MILLIDGYNLIKNYSSESFITDSMKNHFINQLNHYCKRKNHKAILVFDGGGFSFPSKEVTDLVTTIYSGYKNSADDIIKNYITDNKARDLLLITSDRDLQKFAKSLKIQVISAREFYGLLFQKEERPKNIVIKNNDILVKTSDRNNSELDELMNEIGNIAIIKEDDIMSKKNRSSDSISKKDKQLIKKIKKL